MTKMETAIYNKLNRLFTEANWNDITITMKSNNTEILIQPCFDETGVKNMDHIEYFLTSGEKGSHLIGGRLTDLLHNLANYDQFVTDWQNDYDSLKKFFENYIILASDDPETFENNWGFYSDWHKDVFGIRPKAFDQFGL